MGALEDIGDYGDSSGEGRSIDFSKKKSRGPRCPVDHVFVSRKLPATRASAPEQK
jgi:hypothetical protein